MKKKRLFLLWLLLLAMILTACGESGGGTVIGGHGTIIQEKPDSKKPEASDSGGEEEDSAKAELGGLYIIEQMDMDKETITLFSVSTGTMLRYSWSLTTRFLDRFGNNTSWSNFTVGQAVHIGELLASGALSKVQLSPTVWTMDNIVSFTLNTVTGQMLIGGEEYHLSKDVAVFSGDEISAAELISEKDTLRVTGVDDEILAVAVTTGHGYVKLMNTELFDGSLLQIGQKVVTMVSEGAVIEVMEGTYPVTAANNGYGSTKEYTVEKNATTVINMKELEGDGPKTCELSFKIGVENASITLDDEVVKADEILQVSYGRHSLSVSAPGYEDWKRTLVVNSAKATIELSLTEASDSSSAASEQSGSSSEGDSNRDAENSENNSDSSSSNNGSSNSSTSNNNSSNGNSSGNSTSNNSSSNSNSSNRDSDNIRSSGGSAATDYRSEISDRAQSEVDYLTTMSSLLSDLFDSD